jgi:hypothetical protein
MRGDCRYFQKRIYGTGETVQFCALGLAPEAPWRCPQGCPRFEKRVAEVRWSEAGEGAGDSVMVPEPDLAPGAAELLGAAQGIIRAAGPEIVAEHERRRRRQASGPWWQKLREQARRRRNV